MNPERGRFDGRWRARLAAGDAGAVDELAAAMLRPLYGFCFYRAGGDHHLCEEVVQETMLRALREIGAYDPARAGGDVFPWLTGLARNELARVLARERMTKIRGGEPRRLSFELLWERMDEELLAVLARLESRDLEDDVLVRRETRGLVTAALCQLPPRYRDALEAKYLAEQTVLQMAAAMQVTEKAVESLLARAREAFRHSFLALARNLPALEK